MTRAVVDTNVAVSGLLFGGVPSRVIDQARNGRFTWCCSPEIKREIDRVLQKPKFGLTEQEYSFLTEPIYELIEWISPTSQIHIITRCPADNRILECAVDSGSEFIVTGDRRDLVTLNSFQGVRILTPRDFLDTIVA